MRNSSALRAISCSPRYESSRGASASGSQRASATSRSIPGPRGPAAPGRSPAQRRVVFDLRGLVFLDLAGLRTILRTDAQGRAEAFQVMVVRPPGTANRVFTLTPAGERLSIIDEPGPA